ncbi:MAG: hypothetical protein RMJ53_02080 [Chitinophagales bacterium]|nr:hypothetical protein [Chitinophagales bacterium]MDW8272998.1 hypothetical protein [Chitinophagales bacterium]
MPLYISLKKQLTVGFLTLFGVLLLYALVPGYRWAVEEIGFKNYNFIKKIEAKRKREGLPPLSVHEKRSLKMEGYYYLQLMQSATPLDAVILLPPRSLTEGTRHEFLHSSEWVSYFVYPRLCIGYDERHKNPELFSRITHVAIVKGWGYQFLKYEVQNKEEEAVMPVEKNEEK